ncbi:ISNCY family transposase [Photorhabdus luminescens]|uniref:Rpn family recombination-promoting nuclease/putative transposase n=1 Tax=Photorhabdus luminescens TaxID=29488 RepID=UPI000B4DD4BD|nr:Rpn family recombination-promoting nuclease/putative transposase [Photorhabdus luminescens]OWO82108.1 ISNCY family transposase [Photorhabdus luminescens]
MKRKNTPTPHDAIFKKFLSHIDTARDFLEIHLPATLRAVCDLDTLRLESGSFIEDNLRVHYSDILYSLKTTRGESYVYCVIEHQSSPDKMMAFRLMRYSISAMQWHLEQGHEKLPLVIPVLFYHGKIRPYPWSTNWFDCFDASALAEEIYSSAFPLVDVTVIPDDEILTHKRVALLEIVQKHIRQRDMAELQQELTMLFAYDYYTYELLKSMLNYILLVGDTADPEGFIRQLAEQFPKYEEVLMTIAQKLQHKGHQEGLKEGLQKCQEAREAGLQEGLQKGEKKGEKKGEEKGKKQAVLEIACRMMNNGIDHETIMKNTGLSQNELEQIHH